MIRPNGPIASRHMKEIPVTDDYHAIAALTGTTPPLRAWRSRDYLAMLYRDRNGHARLSVNRVDRDPAGRDWLDGITWDELQRVKQETVGDRWAVEVYPPKRELVDVHNIRHLWILDTPPDYAWTRRERA